MNKDATTLRFTRADFASVKQVYQIISDNLRWHFTIVELSQKAGINERKLKQLFKREYGVGVHEFLRRSRMEKARTLLQENELSIKEVAYRVGFKSLSGFSTAFRKMYGIPPTHWMQDDNNSIKQEIE